MMTLFEPPFPESRAYWAVFASWFGAQLIKFIRARFSEKRYNLGWMIKTGGMPSAHSSFVSCVAAVTGLYFGFGSIQFLFVLAFTIITMFDAAGVRRNVGRQAVILNKMLDEFQEKGQIQEQRVKELLGHTPVEVFVGATLGTSLAFIFCGIPW